MRGFYSAAAGMFTQQENLNTIGNNIANASTTGYKKQDNVSTSFGEHVALRMSNKNDVRLRERIGHGAFMTVNIDEYTDFTQGPIQRTDRALDMAINGDGFFALETEKGDIVLSRNGQFELDEEGQLKLKGVGYVLNDSLERITLDGSKFDVNTNGEIYQNGEQIDMIGLFYPNEGVVLKKVDDGGVYSTGADQEAFELMEEGTFEIIQKSLEASNVDMTDQLTKMIRSQRNFQSCLEVLKIYDAINEITANQLGKL